VIGSLADEVRVRPQLPAPAIRQAIRRKADVPQDRMARELGVHRVTFLRWERGDRTPRRDHKDAYARLLRELDEATRAAA
jgi:DNA-binding XRE family transcriptional regulator